MHPFKRPAMHFFTSLAFLCLLAHPAMAQKVKKTLTVTLNPISVTTGGEVMGIVALNAATSSAVTVALTSSTTNAVTMPATVTISAGKSAAPFTITAGAIPQTVAIKAAAGGFQSGSANLTITSPVPQMAYELTILPIAGNVSRISAINKHQQIVGYTYHTVGGVTINAGFFYDHTFGMVKTLPDLISLDDMAAILERGLTQSRFHGINDFGVIVGDVSSTDNLSRDGILIDLTSGEVRFSSSLGYASKTSLFRINNSGDVLGYDLDVGNTTYNTFLAKTDQETGDILLARELGKFENTFNRSEVTDTGLVMLGGSAYQTWEYDITADSLTQVSGDADRVVLIDIDSYGRYSGYVHVDTSGRRKQTPFPCVFDPNLGIIWRGTNPSASCVFNDPSLDDLIDGVTLGDVLYQGSDGSIGLCSPVFGEMNVVDLIDPNDPDLIVWVFDQNFPYLVMSEKLPDTNFGAIAGGGGLGQAFLLVPKPFVR